MHFLVPVLSLVLAATPAAVPAATAICDKYCDARDPALSPGDREGASATTGGRRISLHLDDGDDLGWAAVTGGAAGDHVWLDRSFDAGRTWASGSKLGDTATPQEVGA